MNKKEQNIILKLRLEENTIKEIADKFNMSETAIADNLKIVYENSNDNIKAKLDEIAYKIKSLYKEDKLKDTLNLRLEYRSVTEIADIMNCKHSTIQWRLKEIYKEGNENINKNLDKVKKYFKYRKRSKISFYDLTDYQKGIFWGIGSYVKEEDSVTFKDRRKHFLKIMGEITGNKVYKQITPKNKKQYVVKSYLYDIETFKKNNWTERKAKTRELPPLKNYKDFLRAYIELHSGLGYSIRRRKKKYKGLRLRIYGNWKLIKSVNKIINENTKIGLKNPQNAPNEITKILVYTNTEQINKIYEFIYGEPYYKEYWKDVNYKLDNPKKYIKRVKNERSQER